MKFSKMQGLGNDYIYVNTFEETVEDPVKTAIFVSDRHFGIGGDGLILINPSKVADCEMEMYNADGSRGEMCGNGIRCVAKYVYDRGICKKEKISIETLAGIKTVDITEEDGEAKMIRVDMGSPILNPKDVPVDFSGDKMVNEEIVVDGKTYRGTAVSMGNPHFVIFMEEDVRDLDLNKIGPSFENHKIFPNRVNTEFVNIIDRTHIRMRVWERGSGETLACGTGSCACVVAGVLNGLTDNEVDVELLGGHLIDFYDEQKNTVFMTGPANFVFDGEVIC